GRGQTRRAPSHLRESLRPDPRFGPPPAAPATDSSREKSKAGRSRTMACAASLASSTSSGRNEIAPTTACPPPLKRSHIEARLCRRGVGLHGLNPAETLALAGVRLTLTEYVHSGKK